jgi:hypothetical protein
VLYVAISSMGVRAGKFGYANNLKALARGVAVRLRMKALARPST